MFSESRREARQGDTRDGSQTRLQQAGHVLVRLRDERRLPDVHVGPRDGSVPVLQPGRSEGVVSVSDRLPPVSGEGEAT